MPKKTRAMEAMAVMAYPAHVVHCSRVVFEHMEQALQVKTIPKLQESLYSKNCVTVKLGVKMFTPYSQFWFLRVPTCILWIRSKYDHNLFISTYIIWIYCLYCLKVLRLSNKQYTWHYYSVLEKYLTSSSALRMCVVLVTNKRFVQAEQQLKIIWGCLLN